MKQDKSINQMTARDILEAMQASFSRMREQALRLQRLAEDMRAEQDNSYNQALEDALNVVEWDGYTLDIKERIERLKR